MKSCRTALLAIIAIALLVLVADLTPSQADNQSEYVPGEVIVRMKPNLDTRMRWAAMSASVGSTVSYNGSLHTYRLGLRRGLSIDAAITILSKRADVEFAEPNYIYHLDATPNDPAYATKQYGPQKAKANFAWDIWNPQQQVIVAIVDTGIDNTHPDLTNKILRDVNGVVGFDAFTGLPDPASDLYGHGTHCAGIAAAETNNGIGIAGIAGWNGQAGSDTNFVKLMPVRVLDQTGSGTSQTVADGITWAADHGAKVISLSLGGGSAAALNTAVQHAWNLGCVVCASAGNSSSSGFSYPAAYANVISVAATDKTDTLTWYSNYGSWVLVAAPGGGASSTDYIWSTTPTYAAGGNFPLNYAGLSGTSMACPHVAGEAALIMSQNPTLSNSQVKSLILTNVDPYNPYRLRTIKAGAGRINIYAALLAAGGGTPPTPPSAPTGLNANTVSSSRIDLAWTDTSNNETGFKIERSTDGVNYAPLTTTAANVVSYQDMGLIASKTYYYRVSATNAGGDSAKAGPANATTLAATPPNAPSNLAATAVSSTQINLVWADNSNDEAGFKIERSTDGVNFTPLLTTAANATTYQDTGLSASTTYYYRIRATNANGDSLYSNTANATTQAVTVTPPAAPTNVLATALSQTQIRVTWTDVATNENEYRVYRSLDGINWLQIVVLPANSVTYTDNGLIANTKYFYYLRSYNTAGHGTSSKTSATTFP